MNEKKKYLCVVIDRYSKEELASFIVEATEEYCARHIAADQYEKNNEYDGSWCVDSVEL